MTYLQYLPYFLISMVALVGYSFCKAGKEYLYYSAMEIDKKRSKRGERFSIFFIILGWLSYAGAVALVDFFNIIHRLGQ
jgi:hypothetical protein